MSEPTPGDDRAASYKDRRGQALGFDARSLAICNGPFGVQMAVGCAAAATARPVRASRA